MSGVDCVAIGAIVIALIVAGCGGSSDTKTSAPAKANQPTATTKTIAHEQLTGVECRQIQHGITKVNHLTDKPDVTFEQLSVAATEQALDLTVLATKHNAPLSGLLVNASEAWLSMSRAAGARDVTRTQASVATVTNANKRLLC